MSEPRQHISTMPSAAPTPDGSAPVPMPPTDRELALLQRVLERYPLDGRSILLGQLRMLQVAPGSDPTTRIYVLHPDAPRSSCARNERRRVLTVPVHTPHGTVAGDLSVWVDHGHLCALHYAPRHGRRSLTLPAPEWVRSVRSPERAVSGAVLVRGAREALAGVRLLLAPPAFIRPQIDSAAAPMQQPSSRRAWAGRSALAIVITVAFAFTVALMGAAFWVGHSGGADLGAARTAGTDAGEEQGLRHGAAAGTFTGRVEGERAGYSSTWQAAYDQARATRVKAARQAALKRRRAAKAAAAEAAVVAAAATAGRAQYADNTTCSGYRDARGYWICS